MEWKNTTHLVCDPFQMTRWYESKWLRHVSACFQVLRHANRKGGIGGLEGWNYCASSLRIHGERCASKFRWTWPDQRWKRYRNAKRIAEADRTRVDVAHFKWNGHFYFYFFRFKCLKKKKSNKNERNGRHAATSRANAAIYFARSIFENPLLSHLIFSRKK